MQDFYNQTIRVCESTTPAKVALFRLSFMELGLLTANNELIDWPSWW